MKFLAWFLGIILLLLTPTLIVFFNFKQIIFSPVSTKKVLIETDFYAQAKSIIKKSLFETDSNSAEIQNIMKITNKTFDEYDFQPKIEKMIDDFYSGLGKNGGSMIIVIDLNDVKTKLIQNTGQGNDNTVNNIDVSQIPDSWKVDLAKYSAGLRIIAFFYQNYLWIMVVYIILVALFLLFCLLSGARYLKLFFTIFLIIGIFILIQKILIGLIDFPSIFSALTDQGRTGLQIVIESLSAYFKQEISRLLLWESVPTIVISIVGLVTFSLIGQKKVSNIPLDDRKTN